MESAGGTGTYMVETRIVGITRSGITSKSRRTNNQAVGLHKEKSGYMRTNNETQPAVPIIRVRALTHKQWASRQHIMQRAQTRKRDQGALSENQSIRKTKTDECGDDARGRIGIRRATGTPRWCRSSSSTAHRRTRPAAQISRCARERTSYP